MPLSVQCFCGTKFSAPREALGQVVNCPNCKHPLRVETVPTVHAEDIPTVPGPPPESRPRRRRRRYEEDDEPREVHYYHHGSGKSGGVAAILEVLPGLFFQTFGIGHMYAGNVGLGLFFMFGYWFLAFINFLLCFVFIGFITFPLCWLIAMILSPILAASSCNER
jgi:hypothetical protein